MREADCATGRKKGKLGTVPHGCAMGDKSDQWLPLLDAMIAWCDPVLVGAVKGRERRCTFESLRGFSRPALLPKVVHASSINYHSDVADELQPLAEAWFALERDFCDRVIRGEISIQGVQIAPELETEHPGREIAWEIDYRRV